MRSMTNQLSYAVGKNKAIGQSKHADKGNGKDGVRHDGRSYSWQTHNARLDTAKQFGKWMGAKHPEIERAIEIKAEHINEFLEDKRKTCRQATLESYTSNLRTLTKMIDKTYHMLEPIRERDIITPITQLTPSRTIPMAENDMRLLQNSLKQGSTAYRAMTLERATGARVEGLSKIEGRDIQILSEERAIVQIRGEKGGRDRNVDVFGKMHVQALQELKRAYPDERICPIKPDSINKALNRALSRLNLKKKYELTSVHSMRKAWAQERYDLYREHHSKWQTIRYVNEQLGHGAERDVALLARYVTDIH